MKAAIYGASTSGYYANELLKIQGYSIGFYIDKSGKVNDSRIVENIPVYTDICNIAKVDLEKIDLIIVALGDKKEARKVKENLIISTKKLVKTIYDEPYGLFYKQIVKNKINYLDECGFYRSSTEEKPVDKNGVPVPWITYPCIEFLKSRINKDMLVFEFGSGNSTLWWSDRVKQVYSVEHDKIWFEKVNHQVNNINNVKIIYKELEYGGEYSKEIKKYSDIDIIIIDGRDRVNCAINSLHSLSDRGVIIWDNTDRNQYKKGFDYLMHKGYKKIDFIGMMPIYDFKSQTSIFYKEGNCLSI